MTFHLLTVIIDWFGLDLALVFRHADKLDHNVRVDDLSCLASSFRFRQMMAADYLGEE